VLDGGPDPPRERGIWWEMGRRSATYRENVASAVQNGFTDQAAVWDVECGLSPRNRVLYRGHIGATWQIRLNDCARRLPGGLPPGVVTWPLPKLLWN